MLPRLGRRPVPGDTDQMRGDPRVGVPGEGATQDRGLVSGVRRDCEERSHRAHRGGPCADRAPRLPCPLFKVFHGIGVVDHDIAAVALGRRRPLGADEPGGLVLEQSSGHEASAPHLDRRVDQHDEVEGVGIQDLEQQGDVVHHDTVSPRRGGILQLGSTVLHGGVNDRTQGVSSPVIVQHHPAQPVAVQRAVR